MFKEGGGGSKPGSGARYCEQCIEEVYEWRLNGLTVKQMAKNWNVKTATVFYWIRVHPEFKKAYTAAREGMTTEIENELYNRAREKQILETSETINADGSTQTTTRTKILPADISAIKYILGNRSAGEWKNPDHVIEFTDDEIIVKIPRHSKEEK